MTQAWQPTPRSSRTTSPAIPELAGGFQQRMTDRRQRARQQCPAGGCFKKLRLFTVILPVSQRYLSFAATQFTHRHHADTGNQPNHTASKPIAPAETLPPSLALTSGFVNAEFDFRRWQADGCLYGSHTFFVTAIARVTNRHRPHTATSQNCSVEQLP